jgi:serine/threonine-protein kinase
MSDLLCPFCGKTHRDGARFCPTTGRPIPAAPQAAPPPAAAPPSSSPAAEGAAGLTGRLPPHSLLHERYLIIRKVGQGGMAAVYQTADTWHPGTSWAVKEMSDAALSAHDREFAVQSFMQEARLLGALRHPNLPRVVDAFTEGGKHYLVMEFVPGQTLQDLLQQRNTPFAEETVLPWAMQLCEVLAYLHSQEPKIIFRDIKPSNVMITPDGRVKLIDFGIARFFKPGKTTDTMALGTPGYASPEAVTGQTDERSDIYSLCIMLHQLLTLFNPLRDMFNPPQLRRLNPSVSVQMERILMRGVQNLREHRWQGVPDLQQELFSLQTGVHQLYSPLVQPGPSFAAARAMSAAPQVIPPTQQAGPGIYTSRPTTRLLQVVRQLSGRQMAALMGGAVILIVMAATLLADTLDELDFNWNNIPLMALFGVLGYAAYPRRGAAFLANGLLASALVAAVWLQVPPPYSWWMLPLAVLISGIFMEIWVAFMPRIKGALGAEAWKREALWLALMAGIGSTLFNYTISSGSIGVDPLRFLAGAILGVVGWFLGDLLQQFMLQRPSGFKYSR